MVAKNALPLLEEPLEEACYSCCGSSAQISMTHTSFLSDFLCTCFLSTADAFFTI